MKNRFACLPAFPRSILCLILAISALLVLSNASHSAQVDLIWDPPDIEPAGYKIHYGTSSGNYTKVIDVGNTTSTAITELEGGYTYYFAATAYFTNEPESDFSNEIFIFIPKSDTEGGDADEHYELNLGGGTSGDASQPSGEEGTEDGDAGGPDGQTSLDDLPPAAESESGDDTIPLEPTNLLYFPHIAANGIWETELCIINANNEKPLAGELKAYDQTGRELSSAPVSLESNARKEMIISREFSDPETIKYIIFESDSEDVIGYTKFYIAGKYRDAIPATSSPPIGDIHIPHIASGPAWWTGISLVNTTSSSKDLTLEFNNGTTKSIRLGAGEHRVFTIRSLFGDEPQPTARSAVLRNSAGVIGLELFGSTDDTGKTCLSGISLTDETGSQLHYPHVTSGKEWWTGIVAYNPSNAACELTITPYRDNGAPFSARTIHLDGRGKYVGTADELDLPTGTAWFSIIASSPVTGFELFGSTNENQLGGLPIVGIDRTDGVFPKIEKDGWTGIAFVNTEASPISITLMAYDDDGQEIDTNTIVLGPYQKMTGLSADLFTEDISAATHIRYTANGSIAGFQLNGSEDGMMLDGLPGL